MSEPDKIDLEELKANVFNQIKTISENSDDEELVEKINKFSTYLKSSKLANADDDRKKEFYTRMNENLSTYQRFKKAIQGDVDIDPGRLMGLTDGIFGMVMTLLIFGIALPEIQILNYTDFLSFFSSLAPTVGVTIVSFVLLSSFWIYHHEFIKIKNLNFPYLWLNILFLLCISFMPFTTSLIGNYSHFFLSEVLFGVNVFLAILSFYLMYHYASNRRFLENKPSKKEKKYVFHTFLMIMGLTIIVNLLDYNVSNNFIYLFLLVPVISTIRDVRFKMNL